MSTDSPRSTMTAEQMVDSLTGFEEIAIEKHFDGFDVYVDSEAKGVRAARVLTFVDLTRQGKPAGEAKKEALGLTVREVTAYFTEADDQPELDPDDPTTDAGKGDGPSI